MHLPDWRIMLPKRKRRLPKHIQEWIETFSAVQLNHEPPPSAGPERLPHLRFNEELLQRYYRSIRDYLRYKKDWLYDYDSLQKKYKELHKTATPVGDKIAIIEELLDMNFDFGTLKHLTSCEPTFYWNSARLNAERTNLEAQLVGQ